MTIKLRDKQAEALSTIQKQKTELSKAYTTLNEKESLLTELILEEAGIPSGDVKSAQLQDKSIIIELKPKPEAEAVMDVVATDPVPKGRRKKT